MNEHIVATHPGVLLTDYVKRRSVSWPTVEELGPVYR